jgi:hypothetical protein
MVNWLYFLTNKNTQNGGAIYLYYANDEHTTTGTYFKQNVAKGVRNLV